MSYEKYIYPILTHIDALPMELYDSIVVKFLRVLGGEVLSMYIG